MADDTRRRLAALARRLEPDMQDAFLSAIRNITSEAQLTLLIEAIERGNIDDAIRVLQIRPETFDVLQEQFRATFIAGGAYQLSAIPDFVRDPASGARLVVRFGGNQPAAAEIIRNLVGALITNITEGVRETVTDVVADGIDNGKGADAIALDLVGRKNGSGRRRGGVIGLAARDALTVQSVRSGLAEGDTDRMRSYLGLKSRVKRFDGIIRRALKDGKAVSRADTTRIADAMGARLLRARGKLIARTEAIAALNAGRIQGVQQLVDTGVIRRSQVKKVWDATGDARTRLDHMAMEGQSVDLDGLFTAPDGSLLAYPADSSHGASAGQVIGCRCFLDLSVDWLAGVR